MSRAARYEYRWPSDADPSRAGMVRVYRQADDGEATRAARRFTDYARQVAVEAGLPAPGPVTVRRVT